MPDLFLELRDDSGGDDQTPAPLPEEEALKLLRSSEITASRLIPWGSNYSFAVALETDDGRTQLAIYKPKAGEAPLYDFPDGTLYRRELAAYLFSRWAGWDLVPPTVIRHGPQGIGSVQLYVQPEGERPDRQEFWGSQHLDVERLVLFDHLVNNADRKISHCLRDPAREGLGYRSRADFQPRSQVTNGAVAVRRPASIATTRARPAVDEISRRGVAKGSRKGHRGRRNGGPDAPDREVRG